MTRHAFPDAHCSGSSLDRLVVDLSERGESLRALQDIYNDVNRILLDDLSTEDAERLFNLLDRVDGAGRDWLSDVGRLMAPLPLCLPLFPAL